MSYTHSGGQELPLGRPVRSYHDENGSPPFKKPATFSQPGWNLFRSTAKGEVSVSERKKEDEGLSKEPIREDEEDSQPSPSSVPFAVRRTMSKIDPDGLKDRDV